MPGALRIADQALGLSPYQVDELVRMHLHHPMALTGLHSPALNGDGFALVTELLRLARLGAVAEEEIGVDRTTLNTTIVRSQRQRWARETGLR